MKILDAAPAIATEDGQLAVASMLRACSVDVEGAAGPRGKMPRYFFNVTGSGMSLDKNGTELPGPLAARREAIAYLGSLMQVDPDVLPETRTIVVSVYDESMRIVCQVHARAYDAEDYQEAFATAVPSSLRLLG